jgi:hypothetical protein
MYTQLFKNAFLAIEYDGASTDKFVAYCRNHIRSHLGELTIVDELAIICQPGKAILCKVHMSVLQSIASMHGSGHHRRHEFLHS